MKQIVHLRTFQRAVSGKILSILYGMKASEDVSHQSFFQLFQKELPQPNHNPDRILQIPMFGAVSFEMFAMQIYNSSVRKSFLRLGGVWVILISWEIETLIKMII